MVTKVVFLDTNFLLHYLFPDQLDWRTQLQAGTVEIVLAPVILRELNKHKDNPSSPKLRSRAASILVKLDRLFAEGLRAPLGTGVTLRYEIRNPPIDFATHDLVREMQDDQLIASMLFQRQEDPDTPIVLVTADTGLRLKAQAHGFAIHRPPIAWKLPAEDDPQEKRLKELERENAELRSRLPKLSLGFASGEQHLHIALEAPVNFADTIARKEAEEREKHPKRPLAPPGFPFTTVPLLSQPTAEAIEDYNDELERYYARYEAFLHEIADYLNRRRRTICLQFVLTNTGTAPAEDIDVILNFPDGSTLVAKDDLPPRPVKPSLPRPPRSIFDGAFPVPLLPSYSPVLDRIPMPDPSAPRIRRTNSYEVRFHLRRLKQQLSEELRPLWLIFDSYASASSFRIDYRLNAANLPHEEKDQLHVIVTKEMASRDSAPAAP